MPKGGITGAIAKRLSLRYPNTVVPKKAIVCKTGPAHFIEGAVVEWTSWKGKFFIWSLMSPLWAAKDQPTLSYSERLGHGHLFKGCPEEIADHAAQLIGEHEIFGQRLTGPETSLERFLSGEHRHITRFSHKEFHEDDRGIALALLGETDEALRVLTSVVDGYVRPISDPYAKLIDAIRQSLLSGDGQYLAIITERERQAALETKLTHASEATIPA